MIKNLKMKTALTSVITILTILSITLLYATTQSGMTSLLFFCLFLIRSRPSVGFLGI